MEWLERRHPEMFAAAPKTASLFGEDAGMVDVAAITRAASAVSGKILLDDLFGEVIKASVVSAGATRALLLLLKGPEFIVGAEAAGDGQGGAIAAIAFRFWPGTGAGGQRRCGHL